MGIGIFQVLIIVVLVVVLFGTNRLKNFGSDLGSSVREFKKAIKDEKEVETKDIDNSSSSLTTADSDKTKKVKELHKKEEESSITKEQEK